MSIALAADGWLAPRQEQAAPTSKLAFGALLAFMFVLLVAPQETFPSLAPLRLGLLAIGVALATNLASRYARGLRVLVLTPGAWLAVALGAWALITTPFSYWPGGSFALFRDLFVKSLIVFWLIPQVVDTPARLRRITAWLCALGLPIALTAVRHWAAGDFLTDGAVHRIVGYDAPLTSNPNDLALMLNLLLPLTYALLHIYRSQVVRAALGALFGLELCGIILTYSRAGFIALAAVWIVHVLRSFQGPRRVLAALAVTGVLAGIAIAPSGYAEHLSSSVDIKSDVTGSAQARWGEMVAAVGVVIDQPLVGAGLGQNIIPITHETGGWRMVHDVYLQYASDLGLPGLVLFLALFARCLADVRWVVRQRENQVHHIARGLELSLWAFAVAGIFAPAGYHFYVFFLGGLALAARAVQAEAT